VGLFEGNKAVNIVPKEGENQKTGRKRRGTTKEKNSAVERGGGLPPFRSGKKKRKSLVTTGKIIDRGKGKKEKDHRNSFKTPKICYRLTTIRGRVSTQNTEVIVPGGRKRDRVRRAKGGPGGP